MNFYRAKTVFMFLWCVCGGLADVYYANYNLGIGNFFWGFVEMTLSGIMTLTAICYWYDLERNAQ